MSSPVVKELVYIPVVKVVITNSKTDQALVDRIAADLDPNLFKAVPAFLDEDRFILTDGNHRTLAAAKAGYDYVPAVLLTREEFDYIKFSKRSLNFLVTAPPIGPMRLAP